MLILATKTGKYGNETESYIVEISVTELRKIHDKAGYRDGDELAQLKPGDSHNISEGYDFRNDITKAVGDMSRAYDSFAKATPTMHQFVRLIDQQAKARGETQP